MRNLYVCLAALGLAAALIGLVPGPASGFANEQELWRHRNLGKALYETPTSQTQAPAELKKALDLAPNSYRDRLNYGLALLRAGEVDAGIAELEKCQKQDASLPYTWFNLGVAYKRQGRFDDALKQFERMVELVPDEPVSHYNLGLLYELANRPEDGFKQFQIAEKLDANFVAPKFKIYNYYRLHGPDAEAKRALAAFQDVKKKQQAAGDSEDVEWCFYAELYDPSQAHPAGRDASAPAEVKFEDRKLAGLADAKSAGVAALDADGDGKPDTLVWSRTGVRLYRGGAEPAANTGLEALKDVVAVAVGDYDDDGLPDLCVTTETAPHLFHNVKGRFEEKDAGLPKGRFETAVWLDFDHDYDDDLFLLGEKSALIRNDGEGKFEDFSAHFPFAAGRAVAAAFFRVVPDTKSMDLAVSYADHAGVLYRDDMRGVFHATPLEAVTARATQLTPVDIDNDGWLDLAYTGPAGAAIALNKAGKFEAKAYEAAGGVAFADLENRSLTDLIAGKAVRRNQGLAEMAAARTPAGLADAVVSTIADFDADGRTDVASVAKDGSIHVSLNRTATRNVGLRMTLAGVKNMKLAPGTEIEVKAGELYQKKMWDGVPVVFGVDGHKQLDTVRISWANGLIQNQPNEPTARPVTYKEAPRLSGSCPMIFTWNGREFEFITDVLGVAPLGAGSGDGTYFPVDHDEYVTIPGESLKAVDGRYRVRITEELHEVSYLDQVKLVAVDHPASTTVYTNEKFKAPPFPEFRLFGVSRRIEPVSARDERGRDVLAAVARRDRKYAAGFEHDSAGVAGMHSITLDFGPRAAPQNKAVLFLNGWVDWADGSTFVGTSQNAKRALVMPYLQVRDAAGEWRTVIEDMGIPAGKPKTMAVDLTGKFLSSSRQVRIVTNLCLYWDEIFLSNDAAAPEVRMAGVDAGSAELRLRGFSRATIHPRREQPESFEYAKWSAGGQWNQTPGFYTRYGDVRELVRGVDDRLVIMGAGDELQLEFDAAGLPALAAGWRRDFLLLVDGWAKDADANTAYSQTVEPLPFHAMSAYPYPAGERYPEDPAHREYRKRYNTRPAVRLVPELAASLRRR